jgi:hypothetical protein
VSDVLDKDEAESFHSTVARLLYVATRARPDILLAISFLCTRVAVPSQQDKHKLRRLLEYINGTLDMTLTLGADDLNSIRTWVDASYAGCAPRYEKSYSHVHEEGCIGIQVVETEA